MLFPTTLAPRASAVSNLLISDIFTKRIVTIIRILFWSKNERTDLSGNTELSGVPRPAA